MSAAATFAGPRTRSLEDPLSYLRCSTVFEFKKGQAIYTPDRPSNGIYLVISGKVKVCRIAQGGREVIIDIYRPDDFFGESAFLGRRDLAEAAIPLERVEVMTWNVSEIEAISMRSPGLAIGILQLLVQRSAEFSKRIEGLSVDNVARRLADCLIRFSNRFGSRSCDGSVEIIPVTHEFLSQYVGTSREIITHYMNYFRRKGYLQYSRKGTFVDCDALQNWLAEEQ